MVQLWFPGLRLNEVKITRGQFLNISLLGVGIVVPPWDITLLPAVSFWEPFLLIDTDWWGKIIGDAVATIPKLVWDYAKGVLDSWAKAFYEAHSTYEEYVREREQKQKEK